MVFGQFPATLLRWIALLQRPGGGPRGLLWRGMAGLAWEELTSSGRLGRAFGTLGLIQDQCTVEDIRKAYIRLAKKYHPDSALEADTEKFISVSIAASLQLRHLY